MSTSGKPARTPRAIASRTPFSIAGMNSFGITPPTMSFSKTKPAPRSPRLDLHEDVAVLAAAAGLLRVLVLAAPASS